MTIESPGALRDTETLEKPIRNKWLARCAVTVVCLIAGFFLVWRIADLEVGRNRNKPLEVLCVAAYSGDANAVARLTGSGTNSIPDLVALLQTRDSFFRKKIWTFLPKLSPGTRRYLAVKFSPPAAEYTRESAAHALGLLGPQARRSIPDLIRALQDKEGRVRLEASAALARVGNEALPALVVALQDEDASVRHAAIGAISQMNLESRLALPGLAQKLEDPAEKVRNSAAYALTTMGLPGAFALISVAGQGSTNARNAASNALASPYLSVRKVESALFMMAQDESPTRRQRAIKALGHIRVAEDLAVETAIGALQDPSLEVRLAAIETLGDLGSRSQSGVLALAALTSDQEKESIRIAARRALDRIEPKH